MLHYSTRVMGQQLLVVSQLSELNLVQCLVVLTNTTICCRVERMIMTLDLANGGDYPQVACSVLTLKIPATTSIFLDYLWRLNSILFGASCQSEINSVCPLFVKISKISLTNTLCVGNSCFQLKDVLQTGVWILKKKDMSCRSK